MRIELHPEALTELRAATLWYEERQAGLGDELQTAVLNTLIRVAERPTRFPLWSGAPGRQDVRIAVVSRYPHSIAFYSANQVVWVLAFAHDRRRPLYWLR